MMNLIIGIICAHLHLISFITQMDYYFLMGCDYALNRFKFNWNMLEWLKYTYSQIKSKRDFIISSWDIIYPFIAKILANAIYWERIFTKFLVPRCALVIYTGQRNMLHFLIQIRHARASWSNRRHAYIIKLCMNSPIKSL